MKSFIDVLRNGTVAVAAATLLMWSAGAQAASLASAFVQGGNTLSDDSGEVFLDANPLGTPGVIDPGDVFVGALGINFINGVGTAVFDKEITGIFALEALAAPVPTAALSCGGAPSCSITPFGPVGTTGLGLAGFNAALAAAAPLIGVLPAYLDANGLALGGSEIAILFADGAKDFISPDTPAATIPGVFASADGGQPLVRATIGFGPGGIDPATGIANFWSGTGPSTLTDVFGVPSIVGAGSFSALISFLSNTLPANMTSTVGVQGTISNPIFGTPFAGIGVRDDATFGVQVIPEPATLGLLGLGLFGLGALQRRRRKAA